MKFNKVVIVAGLLISIVVLFSTLTVIFNSYVSLKYEVDEIEFMTEIIRQKESYLYQGIYTFTLFAIYISLNIIILGYLFFTKRK